MSIRRGRKDYLKLGDHNATCDLCGQKFKASELRKRWDNLMVCNKDYEERHPMDLIKSRPDLPMVPFARPKDNTQFVTVAPADGSSL